MTTFDRTRLRRLADAMSDHVEQDRVGGTDAFAGAFPPPRVIQDFWTGTYAALD